MNSSNRGEAWSKVHQKKYGIIKLWSYNYIRINWRCEEEEEEEEEGKWDEKEVTQNKSPTW